MIWRTTVVAMALVGCGGNGSVLAALNDSTTRPPTAGEGLPDAVASSCANRSAADTPPVSAAGLCFAGVDYTQFPPGSIFQIRPDGTVATLFQRRADSLTSFAQAPDGTVYFTNAVNGTAVYKIDGAGESIVYQHSTYVRMVRVDSKGQVYFNESTGAGGDGKIYKLVNGVAQVFYVVHLSQVNGFWGDFGFDQDDNLWLSSSNIIGARLYSVKGGVPRVAHLALDIAFMGFRFLDRTRVLFAGQDHELRLLDLCTDETSIVYTVPGRLQTQDVNACPASLDLAASDGAL